MIATDEICNRKRLGIFRINQFNVSKKINSHVDEFRMYIYIKNNIIQKERK